MRILRLSDMFKEFAPEDGAADDGLTDLELTATVYNIKDGRNENIVKYCATLRGYAIFTDMIRENSLTMPPNKALGKAVDDCIEQNVLRGFLLKHREEVIGMLLTEWDWDTALKVSKKEGFEDGMERAARAMKDKGMDVGTITEVTGLPVDTILNL